MDNASSQNSNQQICAILANYGASNQKHLSEHQSSSLSQNINNEYFSNVEPSPNEWEDNQNLNNNSDIKKLFQMSNDYLAVSGRDEEVKSSLVLNNKIISRDQEGGLSSIPERHDNTESEENIFGYKYCKIHPGQVREFICVDDLQILCGECLFPGFRHKGHRTEKWEKVYHKLQRLIEKLKGYLEYHDKSSDIYQEELSKEKEFIGRLTQTTLKNIKRPHHVTIETIKQTFDEMLIRKSKIVEMFLKIKSYLDSSYAKMLSVLENYRDEKNLLKMLYRIILLSNRGFVLEELQICQFTKESIDQLLADEYFNLNIDIVKLLKHQRNFGSMCFAHELIDFIIMQAIYNIGREINHGALFKNNYCSIGGLSQIVFNLKNTIREFNKQGQISAQRFLPHLSYMNFLDSRWGTLGAIVLHPRCNDILNYRYYTGEDRPFEIYFEDKSITIKSRYCIQFMSSSCRSTKEEEYSYWGEICSMLDQFLSNFKKSIPLKVMLNNAEFEIPFEAILKMISYPCFQVAWFTLDPGFFKSLDHHHQRNMLPLKKAILDSCEVMDILSFDIKYDNWLNHYLEVRKNLKINLSWHIPPEESIKYCFNSSPSFLFNYKVLELEHYPIKTDENLPEIYKLFIAFHISSVIKDTTPAGVESYVLAQLAEMIIKELDLPEDGTIYFERMKIEYTVEQFKTNFSEKIRKYKVNVVRSRIKNKELASDEAILFFWKTFVKKNISNIRDSLLFKFHKLSTAEDFEKQYSDYMTDCSLKFNFRKTYTLDKPEFYIEIKSFSQPDLLLQDGRVVKHISTQLETIDEESEFNYSDFDNEMRCKMHGEKIKYICFHDYRVVCDDCMQTNHKDHRCEIWNVFQDETKHKIALLQELVTSALTSRSADKIKAQLSIEIEIVENFIKGGLPDGILPLGLEVRRLGVAMKEFLDSKSEIIFQILNRTHDLERWIASKVPMSKILKDVNSVLEFFANNVGKNHMSRSQNSQEEEDLLEDFFFGKKFFFWKKYWLKECCSLCQSRHRLIDEFLYHEDFDLLVLIEKILNRQECSQSIWLEPQLIYQFIAEALPNSALIDFTRDDPALATKNLSTLTEQIGHNIINIRSIIDKVFARDQVLINNLSNRFQDSLGDITLQENCSIKLDVSAKLNSRAAIEMLFLLKPKNTSIRIELKWDVDGVHNKYDYRYKNQLIYENLREKEEEMLGKWESLCVNLSKFIMTFRKGLVLKIRLHTSDYVIPFKALSQMAHCECFQSSKFKTRVIFNEYDSGNDIKDVFEAVIPHIGNIDMISLPFLYYQTQTSQYAIWNDSFEHFSNIFVPRTIALTDFDLIIGGSQFQNTDLEKLFESNSSCLKKIDAQRNVGITLSNIKNPDKTIKWLITRKFPIFTRCKTLNLTTKNLISLDSKIERLSQLCLAFRISLCMMNEMNYRNDVFQRYKDLFLEELNSAETSLILHTLDPSQPEQDMLEFLRKLLRENISMKDILRQVHNKALVNQFEQRLYKQTRMIEVVLLTAKFSVNRQKALAKPTYVIEIEPVKRWKYV